MVFGVHVLKKLVIACRFVALVATVLLTSAAGQQTVKIKGVVVDPQDAVAVRVRIRAESQALQRQTYSDGEGRFQLQLPPGNYLISFESAGFYRHVLKNFRVTRDLNEDLIIRLEPELPSGLRYGDPPDPQIEKDNAPIPQKLGPRKIS